jgi:CheY-like chemotaxis protein
MALQTKDVPRRPTVLVVDDEPTVRDVVLRVLQSEPLELLGASGGLEALAVARRHPVPIDLLLTDLQMPVMDGRALAQTLRAANPVLKVLFFSAYSGGLFRNGELLRIGVSYLDKPVVPGALREAVALLLQNTPGRRPPARPGPA